MSSGVSCPPGGCSPGATGGGGGERPCASARERRSTASREAASGAGRDRGSFPLASGPGLPGSPEPFRLVLSAAASATSSRAPSSSRASERKPGRCSSSSPSSAARCHPALADLSSDSSASSWPCARASARARVCRARSRSPWAPRAARRAFDACREMPANSRVSRATIRDSGRSSRSFRRTWRPSSWAGWRAPSRAARSSAETGRPRAAPSSSRACVALT